MAPSTRVRALHRNTGKSGRIGGKERIGPGMGPGVVFHPGSRQTSTRRDKAVDPPPRLLMPPDIEGSKLREELHLAVREMVMDPPGHRLPVGTLGKRSANQGTTTVASAP